MTNEAKQIKPAGVSVRALVLKALIRTGKEQSYSTALLENLVRQNRLSPSELSLCAFLYRGVLERKLTLDVRLLPYLNAKNPPQEEAMWLLRLGLFQLLYADKTAPYAAVNETVEAAKAAGYARLSGLCNAVLRAFLRDAGKRSAALPRESAKRLSVTYSIDESLVALLLPQLGETALEAFLQRSFLPKPLWFRVNLLKTTDDALFEALAEDGLVCTAGPLLHSFQVEDAARLLHHRLFLSGGCFVQDLAAQMAAAALDARPGERIFDLCAAPGTKSFALAGLMENRGEILALDLYENRLKKMADGAEKFGVRCLTMRPFDATQPLPKEEKKADRVLADVPCSGLGTISGKPEIRYKTAKSIAILPEIQEKILFSAAEYVKINGILVYATCSINENENQQVIARFLETHRGFAKAPLPESLAFLPEREKGEALLLGAPLQTDGFYFCRMIRKA